MSLRLPAPDGGLDHAPTLTVRRSEWRSAVEALVKRLRQPMLKVLRDSNLGAGDLDEIVLVGGATRMPLVQELLTELFPKIPLRIYQPDHAIALGPAVHPAMINDHEAVGDLVMTDVCPHTLGVAISKQFGDQIKDGYFVGAEISTSR